MNVYIEDTKIYDKVIRLLGNKNIFLNDDEILAGDIVEGKTGKLNAQINEPYIWWKKTYKWQYTKNMMITKIHLYLMKKSLCMIVKMKYEYEEEMLVDDI